MLIIHLFTQVPCPCLQTPAVHKATCAPLYSTGTIIYNRGIYIERGSDNIMWLFFSLFSYFVFFFVCLSAVQDFRFSFHFHVIYIYIFKSLFFVTPPPPSSSLNDSLVICSVCISLSCYLRFFGAQSKSPFQFQVIWSSDETVISWHSKFW